MSESVEGGDRDGYDRAKKLQGYRTANGEVVKSEGEDAKVAVRNVRRDANTVLKDALKAKQLPEDDEKRAQEDVQKMTDKCVAEIDKIVAEKERELLAV